MFPLISIIVPVYNTAPYISKSIESLLAQSYPNKEIVLVDDGSGDASSEICDALAEKHKNICVLHQKNHGIYLSRLNGVKVSHGEYIGFSDSDDFAEPDLFQILYDNLNETKADISHCGYAMVEGHKIVPYYGTGKKIIQNRTEGIRDLLAGTFIEPTLCTKLFKRSLFYEDFLRKRIDYSEDLLLNFQLFQRAEKSVYEDKILYKYIRRNSSICRSRNIDREIADIDFLSDSLDQLSMGDGSIRQFIENKILAKKISLYKTLVVEYSDHLKKYRDNFPFNLRSNDFRTSMQVFLLKNFPDIYNILIKMKSR